MSQVNENMKHLRKLNGYTQEGLAKKMGVTRAIIGAYEEGRADPRITNLIKIGEVFKLPIDLIVNHNLVNMSLDEVNTLVFANTERKLKILSITVDENNEENIELVPQRAAAGYLNGYADPEYIRVLPKFKLPMLPKNATYRAFEISGDSMMPLESGSVLIGQYVEKLDGIKDNKAYILVTRKEGVVFKRVVNHSAMNGKLFLISDNKAYPDYDIPAEEVIEIWEAKAFISTDIPGPKDKGSHSLSELSKIVIDLQNEVRRLKLR